MRDRTRRLLMLVGGLAFALLIGVAAVSVAAAADGDPASKVMAGQDVVVPAGTTIDHDLYAFGSTVHIAGTINGDLVTAAARVLIDGSVAGDVFASGSEVTVNGSVTGDVRAAAAQVTVLGSVNEDLAVAASTLVLGINGRIGGDLLFTATDVALEGNVAGGISGSASDYQRQGTVGGTEDVSLATRINEPAADRTIALGLDALRQFILVLVFGLAMLRFTPGLFGAASDRARTQPLVSSAIGVAVILLFAAAVVAILILMVLLAIAFGELGFAGFVVVDVVGGLLAAFGLTFGLAVFSAFIADAVVGAAIGRLVVVAEGSRWAAVIRLIVGAALVVVVTSFPGLGGIVKLLVILVGLGAFAGILWDGRRRPAPMVVVAPPGA